MSIELRQSTAVDVLFGPFLDETNGKDAETGLTITQAEVRLSKNGGNMAQKSEATSLVHDELGHYVCKLNGTDTNTLGTLKVMVHESGALSVWEWFSVINQNDWDSKYSTDKLQVDLIQMGGVAQSATDLKDFADAGYDPSTDKVNGVKLVDTTTANSDMVGTDSAALATEVAKIPKSDGTSSWNATALGAIQSESNDALVAYDPPTKTELDSAVSPLATTTELNKVPKSDGTTVWNATAQTTIQTKATAALNSYDPPTKTEMDSGHSSLATSTELGKVPKSDASVSWNVTALGAINAEVDTALNTAIPGAPTADSVNQRVKAIDVLSEASGNGDLAAILTDTNEAQGKLPTNKFMGSSDAADHDSDLAGTVIDAANTELAAVPTTTGSLRQMIQFAFTWIRNKKTVTSTTEKVFKEDASTQLGSATLSDDSTTFTKGEMS